MVCNHLLCYGLVDIKVSNFSIKVQLKDKN